MVSIFSLSLLLFSLLRLPTITIAQLKQDIETDQSALVALKSNMLDPSNVLSSWNSRTKIPVCNWTRVICSARHQRVVSLNLSYVGLQGSIAPQIGNLSFLSYIDLEGNSLQGELPEAMMHLRRLRFINLQYNSFSGDVPAWLGSLPKLVAIRFANNSFTGAIPVSLFNASRLEYLGIPHNSLQGTIPQKIGKNGILRYLNMDENQITGSIPQSILNLTALENVGFTANSLSGNLPLNICSQLPKLQGVYLSENNQISGPILSGIGNCSQLQILSIAVNHFNGEIPREIGNLTALIEIDLGRNIFTGEIPPAIGNLLNLENLYLEENELTGKIPEEIGNLQLVELLLFTNSLGGAIPLSIFNMSSMKIISLSNNSFSGSLPPYIGHHQLQQNIEAFGVADNRLTGVIPDSISNLTKLAILELSFNQFTGSVPLSLGTLEFLTFLNLEVNHLSDGSLPGLSFLTSLTNCSNLRMFSMSGNPMKGFLPSSIGHFSNSLNFFRAMNCELEGNIPHEIGNISGLLDLNLGGNLNLDGPLPMELQQLVILQSLNLGGNKISGPIPNYICDFKQLTVLNLARNQFTGQVPECFGNMNSLRSLYLFSNKLDSTLPSALVGGLVELLHFDFHSNFLRGDIPQEIGNMKAAIYIDLSDNNFSGSIPKSIGGLDNLMNLSLSNNQLQGVIPEKLGNMVNLESFDLSHNNLTGHIPIALASLHQLKYFNISFNNLGGEIPSDGSFKSLTYESFMSNGAFCGGPPHLHFPPCPSNSSRKSSARKLRMILHVLIPISVTIFVALCSIIICVMKRTRKNNPPGQIDLVPSKLDERISFYDLQHATNGFNESNLLASGSSGSVYKGELKDGTVVAIKVFSCEREGPLTSFDRECEVLRNVRHRNLVKVISSCSNLDFKALILEFMPNGSLERWLYSHNYFLDFPKRLDIMIHVASALVYLHYGYSSIIVHCDLKPGNVLLDEDMTGRVSDFGIAKIFAGDESMAQTKTLATIGYIAPEYGFEGKVSTSCDVYSFGILLMETFTRKRPGDDMFGEDWGLKEWVSDSLKNLSTDFIDQNLMNTQNKSSETLVQCISDIMELALTCTVESVKDRIDIESALAKLEKVKVNFTRGE